MTAAAFWNSVTVSSTGCWEWTRGTNGLGYGLLKFEGRFWVAHRLAWTLVNGPIPDCLFVCHHCDNRLCANPAHLFLGTHQDNMTDMKEKGRRKNICTGEQHGNSVLTAADVAFIRRVYRPGRNCKSGPFTRRRLAERFGTTGETIYRAARGENWADQAA